MNNSQLSATVVICTYNGSQRIRGVICALGIQTARCGTWELLVIDNASTDNTRAVCENAFEGLQGVASRVVVESRPGLSFARARAATEARGPLLLFLDDDNIPSATWVEAAIEAFSRYPKAGVIGGKVSPRWEIPPTPLAEAVAPFALAICDLGDKPILIKAKGGGIVGAGMGVRTDLLRKIFQSEEVAGTVTDRLGENLISGGDLAISIIARKMGWECWYVPDLQIEHCLPPQRMTKEYLLRLYEGIGRGQAAARRLYDWKARTPLQLLIGLKDYLRWHRHRAAYLDQDEIGADSGTKRDLHELDGRLIYGRSMEALRVRQ